MSQKRERDSDTERIVRSVLEAEAAEKRARKGGGDLPPPSSSAAAPDARGKGKGKEADGAEGTTIKEKSLAASAQARRAAARRAARDPGAARLSSFAADADLGALSDAEEEEEPESEEEEKGAVPLEPFNLKAERTRGTRFDEEEGAAFLKGSDDDGDEDAAAQDEDVDEDALAGDAIVGKQRRAKGGDAWLLEAEGGGGSKKARKAALAAAAAAKAAKEAAAEAAAKDSEGPLTPADVVSIKARLVRLLKEGETPAAALRRLRPKAKTKAKTKTEKGEIEKDDEGSDGKADADAFDQITEAASLLLEEAGEVDAYTTTREAFEDAIGGGGGGSDNGGEGGSVGRADDDDDIFRDDDKGKEPAAAAAPPPPPPPPPPRHAPTDFSTWPLAALKSFCNEAGGGAAKASEAATEKNDLVEAAKLAEAEARERRIAQALSAPPPGYEAPPKDSPATLPSCPTSPPSKLWWSGSSRMFWDPETGLFGSETGDAWWRWDASAGAFVQQH